MLLPTDESNPILHIEELPRFPWRRPLRVPGAVHVYLSRGDHYFWPAGGFTLGELWLVRPSRLYVVDVAPHDAQLHHDVTSASSGATVSLAVSFSWRVTEPRTVVESHLVDVLATVPVHLRTAIDAAIAGSAWADGAQLAAALRSAPLPEWVRAGGIEMSSIRVAVVSLGEGPAAVAGADD